jgi:1,4-dihydroxy-2-naphthoate octaprenyltransferase
VEDRSSKKTTASYPHAALPSLSAWWQAFRFHYVPPSYLPAMLGAVVSWSIAGSFHTVLFLITAVCVTLNHIALNMTDDYFDYLHSVDRAHGGGANPYTGGSRTLTGGLIRPEQMRAAFTLFYALTTAGGATLAIASGWPVLVFGAVGVLSSFFYTAPPVRYAYRGLGELSQLVNFGATIGLGSYYVQARTLSLEALVAVLPLGFMMFSMIVINEIPDVEGDLKGGKRTLVVLLGSRSSVWLYGGAMATAYALILFPPLAGLGSVWSWLGLSTIPWFLKALSILARSYHDPARLAPANLLTIRTHNITGIFLIAGAVVEGALKGRHLASMILPLVVLVAFYVPVALTVFVNTLSMERDRTGGAST